MPSRQTRAADATAAPLRPRPPSLANAGDDDHGDDARDNGTHNDADARPQQRAVPPRCHDTQRGKTTASTHGRGRRARPRVSYRLEIRRYAKYVSSSYV